MATINLFGSRGFNTNGDTLLFWALGTYAVQSGTETEVQRTARSAGTFSNLYCYVSAWATANKDLRLRKNAANGNQVVVVSGTGEFEDTSNTDAVVAGDEVNFSFNSLVGSGATTVRSTNILFAATTNTVCYLTAINSGNLTTASTTWYAFPGGGINNVDTEALAQYTVRTAGTLQNFFVSVSTWSRSTNTVIRTRIDTGGGAANGNMVLTVNATGFFEDTSNTDALGVGDLLAYSITNGTGTGTYRNVGPLSAEFLTTDTSWPILWKENDAYASFAANTTNFFALGGRDYSTTEADVDADANVAFTWSKLTIQIQANGVSADSTLRSRVAGGNGNQVVTIPASTTGLFADTTNTDTPTAAQEINYSLVTGGTGTTLEIAHISSLGQITVGGPTVPQFMPSVWHLAASGGMIGTMWR